MANGMFGANTDELRQVSDAFDMRTTVVESARRTTTRAVEATVWEGRDAEAFKQRYASEVAAMMQQLESVLQLHRTDISKQADEQDECSSAGGGGGDNRPWWQRLIDGLKNLAGDALEKLRDLVDTIRDHIDFSGPRLDVSIKIPGLSDQHNIQIGKEFKNGGWHNVDNHEHKRKHQLGISAMLQAFSGKGSIDIPGGSIDGFVRAGIDGFLGYDASEKYEGGKRKGTEHKVGLELGLTADAGVGVTRDHGGYLETTVGLEGSIGAGIEAKGQFEHGNGKIGLSGRFKAVAGIGGGFSGGISYDVDRAYSDLRNDPGAFLENTGRDLKSLIFGGSQE